MEFSESNAGFSAAAAFLVYSLHHHGRKGGGGRALTSANPFVFFKNQVTLTRPAPGSWGLRLQGGVDVQKALAIINVADGSPSEMSGLKVGWVGVVLSTVLPRLATFCSKSTAKTAA